MTVIVRLNIVIARRSAIIFLSDPAHVSTQFSPQNKEPWFPKEPFL